MMRREFARGKSIVTAVIATILLLNGVGIWFAQTLLLHWYVDLVESVGEPRAMESARMLQTWFVMNQETFMANQVLNFGVVIFLCIMLFIGYNWLRWIWAIHWVLRGVLGTVACFFALLYIKQFSPLIGIGAVVSILYLICGISMLCSHSVYVYMQSLRRPARSVKYH